MIEGLFSSFPELQRQLDIERVGFRKPRAAVVDLVGEENQLLPRLVLADDAPAGLETGSYEGRRFVSGQEAILRALSIRHGIPEPHP